MYIFTFADQQYSYAAFEKSSSESWQGLRGDKDQENCMHVTGILALLAIIGGFNCIKLPLIYMYLIEIAPRVFHLFTVMVEENEFVFTF